MAVNRVVIIRWIKSRRKRRRTTVNLICCKALDCTICWLDCDMVIFFWYTVAEVDSFDSLNHKNIIEMDSEQMSNLHYQVQWSAHQHRMYELQVMELGCKSVVLELKIYIFLATTLNSCNSKTIWNFGIQFSPWDVSIRQHQKPYKFRPGGAGSRANSDPRTGGVSWTLYQLNLRN